ncbi:hypothetical protein FOMPIDRAFT_1050701 [Fomitopsis schrenkii]|uniref:Uncharacterized protein n=1 Tax=Fomitopsis schrenkii TaxID=2126942 RepID=S8E2N6_FOMSC|nr:hypothetical protein FOMPIDRAFT_1050701 [Fomitopsis schrenkii]
MSAPSLPGDFGSDTPLPYTENVPQNLRRATARLQIPPSYIVVGVYRFCTDKNLYVPAWKKCEHGVVRGLGVGLVWAVATFKLQRWVVEHFYMNSPRVLGLSDYETALGSYVPFDLRTFATFFFVATQVSGIVTYFVSHGLRVARERAYNQTIESRNKGPDFWRPYVEEWDNPPKLSKSVGFSHLLGGTVGRIAVRILFLHVEAVPLVGMAISAWFRALGTARYLHKPYFQAKGMTPEQVSIFIEDRKWDYRAFGFVAALLERIPLLGLVLSISNRVGAAMWAVDLEKRQHYVAETKYHSEK